MEMELDTPPGRAGEESMRRTARRILCSNNAGSLTDNYEDEVEQVHSEQIQVRWARNSWPSDVDLGRPPLTQQSNADVCNYEGCRRHTDGHTDWVEITRILCGNVSYTPEVKIRHAPGAHPGPGHLRTPGDTLHPAGRHRYLTHAILTPCAMAWEDRLCGQKEHAHMNSSA